ncbi:DNA polymerase III subunit delta' [Spartinivicinus ruber]|uniref:DNA polymerase III subunit delta' n=1 Tax=Spartinivicinus ruber TaxID=2683272 RepID=UPI0013D0E0C1|nr:DNA polymerase III subunit delta' [Spartinivicinus ruber]
MLAFEPQPLPWQLAQWQQLIAQRQQQKLAHAYLLHGMPGVGKLHFAQLFGQLLLCLKPNLETASPCQQCKSCLLFNASSHPDILQIVPEGSGKPIKVDQIRQLIDFVAKTAQQGGYRVIIIDPADAMNINASNALLKCLEEPGRNTILLLLSERTSALLATIKSRCQVLAFPLPALSVAKAWLQQQSLADNDLDQLLVAAHYQPLTALTFHKNQRLKQRQALQSCLATITKGQKTPVAAAQEWQNEDLLCLFDWLVDWLAEMIKWVMAKDETFIKNHDMLKMLNYVSSKAGVTRLYGYYAWLIEQRQRLLGAANQNKQLVLESLFIGWLHLTIY